MDPKFFNALPQDFLANVKQNSARQQAVAALIAKNEVAMNMTPEEVSKALGKPGKRLRTSTRKGARRSGSL